MELGGIIGIIRKRGDFKMDPKVLVLGLGNTIMSDDGLGVYAIRELDKLSWPQEVKLLDGGTSILNYWGEIGQTLNLIVVDTIISGKAPGTIYRWRAFPGLAPLYLDSHKAGLTEAVALARQFYKLPREITLFGIEPQSWDLGESLSSEVLEALPRLISLVKREVDTYLKS